MEMEMQEEVKVKVKGGDLEEQQRPEELADDEWEEQWKELCKEPLDSETRWHMIMVATCVIAVCLEPLFLYIPIISEEKKCISMDIGLKNAALVLRCLTDTIFILLVAHRIHRAQMLVSKYYSNVQTERQSGWLSKYVYYIAHRVDKSTLCSSVIMLLLILMPVPHALLVVLFFMPGHSSYWTAQHVVNFFLVVQYLVRVCGLYQSSIKLTRRQPIWVICLFNFFLYILAGHVVGSSWYFFSIQREVSCWHQNCGANCTATFTCNDYKNTTAMMRLTTALNESCPTNVSAPFDFGIFLESLKSGNTVSKNFPKKYSYCLWWGVRNLSNFGTNLTTSTCEWENYYAIFISITGLVLFLYLIGNVQTLFQIDITDTLAGRKKLKKEEVNLRTWMQKNRKLPSDLSTILVQKAIQNLRANKDVDTKNLENLLTQKDLKRVYLMTTLRKVPGLERKHKKLLHKICDSMKQFVFEENEMVFSVDGPIDRMIFITKGTMRVDGEASRNLEIGDFYGTELVSRFSSTRHVYSTKDELPKSKDNVECATKVEGFTIAAEDLKRVFSIYKRT